MAATAHPRRAKGSRSGGPARRDRRTRAARAGSVDTRTAVLDAAAVVVARRGLRDASIDEIATEAGCSKGAVYWHFSSKDDLFIALLEDRVDRPTYEMIELLESAPAEQDMGPEASRRFVEVLQNERDLLLLNEEYWAQSVRDPAVRAKYLARQRKLRAAISRALVTRVEHLGAPPGFGSPETIAIGIMGLAVGLAREKLIDPAAVPDDILGRLIVLLYKGSVAEAAEG